MGDIYAATDEVLGRKVVVKLLAERYAPDAGIRERFKREGLAAARLSGQPGAVTIFDVGEWEGRPFIVMEHLAGGSLEQRIRQDGAQPPGRALAWLEQAATALDAAHARGIVHRDVKPANLLLNERDEVRVADFGIASAAGLHSLTLTGTVLGTAGYLSPEQAAGHRSGPASDLYALAVVAYELLSGHRPFARESTTAEAAAHVNAPIPSIFEFCKNLPPEVDPIFQRALAKDPRGPLRLGSRVRRRSPPRAPRRSGDDSASRPGRAGAGEAAFGASLPRSGRVACARRRDRRRGRRPRLGWRRLTGAPGRDAHGRRTRRDDDRSADGHAADDRPRAPRSPHRRHPRRWAATGTRSTTAGTR